jgi:hypothetical protein
MEFNADFWDSLNREGVGREGDALHVVIKPGHIEVKGNSAEHCIAVVSLSEAEPRQNSFDFINYRKVPALILYSICLPIHLRRKGHGTRIIRFLEQRAQREGKMFAIFGIHTEAMYALAQKLDFRQDSAFLSCYAASPLVFREQDAPLSMADAINFILALAQCLKLNKDALGKPSLPLNLTTA